ncbi:hypothetical protein DV26_40975 [Amycolatopsis mediterranei]|nr:hypothetical protein DV26_40975 [Amycolatopsis mediterranei]
MVGDIVVDGPQPPRATAAATAVRPGIGWTRRVCRGGWARMGDRPDPVVVSFTPATSPPGPVAVFAR